MEYPKTNTIVRHSDAEVCLNLWYFQNAGIVTQLAGKAYALVGSEQQKLSVLRSLTGADYLTATRGFVPQKFQMTTASDTLAGAVPANMIHDYHSAVFGPLIDKIEAELPKQIHVVQGKYREFALKLPRDPLCITTCVNETEDGELVASIRTLAQ